MEVFERLANALGILPSFVHAGGHEVVIPRPVRERLAEALGCKIGNDGQIQAEIARIEATGWRRRLPPAAVVRASTGSPPTVPIVLAADPSGRELRVRLIREHGGATEWHAHADDLPILAEKEVDGRRWVRRELAIPDLPEPGYHRLSIEPPGDDDGLEGGEMLLVVAPDRCWQPNFLLEGRRTWGFSVQLYALRSRTNWGHGDFTDLSKLIETTRDLGGGFVGINPLHALFSERPDRCSPYSPNARNFLEPNYLDVMAVPDMRESQDVIRAMAAADSHRKTEAARQAERVDFAAVTAAKRPVFEALFTAFRSRHLNRDSERAEDFRRFVAEGGADLRGFALFEALREKLAFSGPDGTWRPWFQWPDEFRRPDSPAVAEFEEAHRDRIDFHLYLQWEADQQLARAGATARRDLPLGLYRDVAVGFDRDGAEHWLHQDITPRAVSVGCPPDLRNPIGQDWGVLPFSPADLHAAAYEPFIALIRANMRHAGVLRIDHAFQLLRLFWIPLGNSPRQGGYVHYPLDDLLGIVALESHRAECAVVAEDLGTIPEGFRERIIELGALSFRVLHREREPDRAYKPPASYPAVSTVATGTHDQATVTGFWTARDVELRTKLGLYPTPEAEAEAPGTRRQDREMLLKALKTFADLEGSPEGEDGRPSQALIAAVHRFLARTPSRMMIVQPEDLTGETEQVNMPSTVNEHPNWQRRYTFDIEDLARHPMIRDLARLLADEGRGTE